MRDVICKCTSCKSGLIRICDKLLRINEYEVVRYGLCDRCGLQYHMMNGKEMAKEWQRSEQNVG